MKVEMINLTRSTIAEFADKHGLVMQVRERDVAGCSPLRYYASFKRVEMKDGLMLISNSGNGSTPDEAIENYARNISGKKIVYNACGDGRMELDVPILV